MEIRVLLPEPLFASMLKLVDKSDLKSGVRDDVQVQALLLAPCRNDATGRHSWFKIRTLWVRIAFPTPKWTRGGTGRRGRLRIYCPSACRFKSHRVHQSLKKDVSLIVHVLRCWLRGWKQRFAKPSIIKEWSEGSNPSHRAKYSHRITVSSPPFHGGNTDSSPVGSTMQV